ncbi:EamA family transporter [Agathobaculum butyriciproducens]|uniref:EamA family transporter n=1 Tax=Agathobaculum butyriciproducens TaxID=1628085 RepID=UPI003AEFE6A8
MLMHSLCTTVCPYAFYTVALDHMEAGKASILCSCEPVAAMVFGFFFFRAIPHNSKYRYGERGAADAKPKAQIILDAAKVSAASGGCSEPKQGQRSQSARGFCPRCTMRVPQPDIIEHFGNADAVPQPPERCLSRQAGIVRYCLREISTVLSIAGLIIVLIALAMLVLSDKKQEVVEE